MGWTLIIIIVALSLATALTGKRSVAMALAGAGVVSLAVNLFALKGALTWGQFTDAGGVGEQLLLLRGGEIPQPRDVDCATPFTRRNLPGDISQCYALALYAGKCESSAGCAPSVRQGLVDLSLLVNMVDSDSHSHRGGAGSAGGYRRCGGVAQEFPIAYTLDEVSPLDRRSDEE